MITEPTHAAEIVANGRADVVLFLCSEGARFVTGQSINVSGGSVI